MSQTEACNEDAVRELARSLGCLTEGELQALGNLTANTVEAWRKRGTGPSYILFGNRYFYPHKAVADFLCSKVRERRPATPAKGLL